jgi:predicted secreted protein
MYLIIQLVVFFSILPIDVNRNRKFLIPANEVGAPENPKILKKTFYSIGITTIIFTIICLLMKYEYLDLRNIIS